MYGGQQAIRKQWLQAKDDVEIGILRFGFHQTTDHQYREIWMGLAHKTNKRCSVHARHDVIGDHKANVTGKLAGAHLLEGALRAKYRNDEVSDALQDRLSGRGLNGVVIDEEDGW